MIRVLLNKIIYSFTLGLLLVYGLSLRTLAQGVITITENGSKVNLPTQLRYELETNAGIERQLLLEWYASKGFLNASFSKVSENLFEINTGCRFTLSDFKIEGYKFEDIISSTPSPYSVLNVGLIIDEVLFQLEKEGFLFARVEIESLTPNMETCEVSVLVNVKKGRQWLTKKILFPGANSNKPEYLKLISGFRDSLIINSMLLDDLESKLVASELFDEVSKPEIFIEDDAAVIVIGLQERVLNQFDGLLGYVPDQNGNGQLVGDFELSLWNVLNQGNGFNLEYQRLKPETSRLNIGISQDWFGSIPVGLGFNFNLYQNDTTYQTRNLSIDSYYLISTGLRLTGSVGQIFSTSSNSTQLVQEPDGKKRYAELGFRYSTLNNRDVPTSGVRFGISFGTSRKSVEMDSLEAFNQRFIHSEASYFIPIASKSILAFSAKSYFLNADKVTESDLVRFGGANSFRGYSEEQFWASRLLWGDIEYRFLINRSSYLFAFGAIGSYHRPKLLTETNSQFKTTDILYSTGFGISYKIRVGRLKFTYAVSPEESIGNGKVHLGIITSL